MMHLPKFPQFDEVTATPATNVETNQNNKLLFNMGVSTKDATSIYNLEIAFGTSFAILTLIIVIMALIIWQQRRHILRLRVYFNGQPQENPQHQDNGQANEEDRRPIFNAGNQQGELGDLIAVENNNNNIRLHQNQDVTPLFDLMFPRDLSAGVNHLRNITALRSFHKSQREALKAYASRQEELYRNQN